ncbi:MAG: hypothetical protein ABIH92_03750 [Nanoarchaeota archaeon]
MRFKLFTLTLVVIFSLSLTSAVIINSVQATDLAPGQEGQIEIEVENILDKDAIDVSLTLNFQGLPFIPLGTSEQSINEIDEDDEEEFIFRLRASNNIEPGDYEIPYTLSYEVDDDERSRSGTIGIKVSADPDLTFSIDTTNPIQNRQGKLTVKIINKGFFDARFVSLKVIPDGFTLLSDDEAYIGEIESDDFETESFDVIFKNLDANVFLIVEYKDFDNNPVVENIELPLQVYSEQQALEFGLITQSKTASYVIGIIVIIVLIIIWRSWRRRARRKKSERR